MAMMLLKDGRSDQAIEAFRAIYQRKFACYGYTRSTLVSLVNLGDAYHRKGFFIEAEQCFRQAVHLAEKHIPQSLFWVGIFRVYLAKNLIDQKDFEQGLNLYEHLRVLEVIKDTPSFEQLKHQIEYLSQLPTSNLN